MTSIERADPARPVGHESDRPITASGDSREWELAGRTKGYPFEVPLLEESAVEGGVVLADQIKSISWTGRRAAYAGTADNAVVANTRAKIRALLQIP